MGSRPHDFITMTVEFVFLLQLSVVALLERLRLISRLLEIIILMISRLHLLGPRPIMFHLIMLVSKRPNLLVTPFKYFLHVALVHFCFEVGGISGGGASGEELGTSVEL